MRGRCSPFSAPSTAFLLSFLTFAAVAMFHSSPSRAASSPSTAPATNASGVLPAGSVWRGNVAVEPYGTRPQQSRAMTLRVTKREDDKFAAHCVQMFPGNRQIIYEVEGIVSRGRIEWRTTRVIKGDGDGPGPVSGMIESDKGKEGDEPIERITGRFDDKGGRGHPIRGTVSLQRAGEEKGAKRKR